MASKKKQSARPPTPPEIVAEKAPSVVVPPVDVTMNLTTFVAIDTGKFCALGQNDVCNPILITPSGARKGIKHLAGGTGTDGILLSKSTPIEFDIANYVDNPVITSISIVGCFIVPKADGQVELNFDKIWWSPKRLGFQAKHAELSKSWKLFVAIVATIAGVPVLGIIDPDIENDSTTNPPAPLG